MDRLSNILKQQLEAAQSAHAVHPSTDTLVAFVEQGLGGAQREAVLGHLSVCRQCREAVALATPEAAAAAAAKTSRSLRFAPGFPAAMRWASIAAALAVAVGVGVIAYEHETTPIERQAMLSREQSNASAASPAPVPSRETASKSSSSPQARSSLQPGPIASAAKKEAIRARPPAQKDAELREAITSKASPPPTSPERSDTFLLKALPVAPEAQPALAKQREPIPTMQANSASPTASGAITGANKAAQDLAVNAEAKSAQDARGIQSGPQPAALVEAQPAPAKALNAVGVSGGSGAKTKLAYGVLGFVHWTISAAGKLERRAVDGTLTIVEPVPGAIIRTVAAEGIEVWAGGSQSPPSAKNVQPRAILVHSSDAGETWKTINGPWQGSITRVNLAGLGSLTVFATDGSWSTGDGGKSWSKP